MATIRCLAGEDLGVVLGIKNDGTVIQLSGRKGTEEYRSGTFFVNAQGEFDVKDNDPARDGVNSAPRELTDEEKQKNYEIIMEALDQIKAREK